MGDYSDLVSVINKKYSDESDPFYQIGARVLSQQAPEVLPKNGLWGAFLPGFSQGLLGGTALGYGKQNATSTRQRLSSELSSAPTLGSNQFSEYVKGNDELSKIPELGLLNQSKMSDNTEEEKAFKKAILAKQVESGEKTFDEALSEYRGDPKPIATSADNMTRTQRFATGELGLADARNSQEVDLARTIQAQTSGVKTKLEDSLSKRWDSEAGKNLETLVELRDSAKALSELNNPAADVALKEMLQRSITPAATAVRVEFFKKIDQAANPLNKIKGDVQKWLGGGDTAPETRAQILSTISTIANEKISSLKNLADNKYRKIAENRGLDFTSIIPDYDARFSPTQGLDEYKNSLGGGTQYSEQDLVSAGYSPRDIAALQAQGKVR